MSTQPTAPPERVHHLTFRSSRIIYYGPHQCGNCGVLICKMGHEFGGNAFTYPDGPIYPNTEWHPHVCDPKMAAALPKPAAAEPPAEAPRMTGYCAPLNPPVISDREKIQKVLDSED